jgi:hypothetical protein
MKKLQRMFDASILSSPAVDEEAVAEQKFSLPDYRTLEKHQVSGAGRERVIGPVLMLNASREVAEKAQKTVVVMGGYRGGTSMVAGLLRLMGVFMGFEVGMRNNEDLDFQDAGVARILELIADRNRLFDLWGWKNPGTIYNIEHIQHKLRNPFFIVVFRDLMAVAQNEIAKNVYDFEEAVWRAADQQMRLADFVLRSRQPVLAVSYERASKNREEFVRNLAGFLALGIPDEDLGKIARFVQRFGRRVSLFRRREKLTHYAVFEEKHNVREIRGGKLGKS